MRTVAITYSLVGYAGTLQRSLVM